MVPESITELCSQFECSTVIHIVRDCYREGKAMRDICSDVILRECSGLLSMPDIIRESSFR